MGKRIFNVFLFLLVIGGAVAMTLYVGQGMSGMIIYNFIFLGVMVFIYLIGMFCGMFRIGGLSSAFLRATDEIKTLFKIPGKKDTDNLAHLNGVFEHRYLDQKMDNFVTSVENSEAGLGEIDEYINDDDIEVYTHKRLLEMVPDMLTGLGILGTFVGLVWGLKGFQPGSYETMTTSVSSLVDGIKVAFMTSIYGISFSLIFSYGMRSEYSAMSSNLQGFLERFHAYVFPTAENESRNLLLSTQKMQAEAMEKVAEQVSEQLAGSFERVITPTFQKMNTSLDLMVTSVTRCQQDAIKDILDVFMSEMHNSFQNQFRQFGETLNSVSQAQKHNAQYTTELYQNMGNQLQSMFVEQEKTMTDSVTKMQSMQLQFLETAERVMTKTEEIQNRQDKDYQNLMDYMKEAQDTSAKFWVACNQAMQKYVEAAAQSMETAGVAQQNGMEIMIANKQAVEALVSQVNLFNENEQRMYAMMEQLRGLFADITVQKDNDEIHLLGGRIDRLSSQKTAIDNLRNVLEEQNERQEEILSEISKNIRDLTKAQKGKFGLFK